MRFEKPIRFNLEKNKLLKQERGVSFEDVIACVENDRILDITRNVSPKFGYQLLLIVEIENYAFVVPYVETKEEIFLKTIYPSRVMTKRYLV